MLETQSQVFPKHNSEIEIQQISQEQLKYSKTTKNIGSSQTQQNGKSIFDKKQTGISQKQLTKAKGEQEEKSIENLQYEIKHQKGPLKQNNVQDQSRQKVIQDQISKDHSKKQQEMQLQDNTINEECLEQENSKYQIRNQSQLEQSSQLNQDPQKEQICFKKIQTTNINQQQSYYSFDEGMVINQDPKLNISDNKKLGRFTVKDTKEIEHKVEEEKQSKQENTTKSFQQSCIDIQGLEMILNQQRTKIRQKSTLFQNEKNTEQQNTSNINITENHKTNEPLQQGKKKYNFEKQNLAPFKFQIRPKNQVNNSILKEKINLSNLIDKILDKSSNNQIEEQRGKDNQGGQEEKKNIQNQNVIDEGLNYIQQTENMTQIQVQQFGYLISKIILIKQQVKYQNKDLIVQLLSIDVLFQDSKKRDPLIFIIIQDLWQDLYQKKVEDIQKEKLRLFATLSHELRTPLNCSISMLEVLKDELSEQQNSEFCIEEYINPALFSNKLLLNQINDILDFVQMDCGKFKYSFFDFSVVNLLRDCCKLISIQAKMKNIHLIISYDQKINQQICSDPNRIRQILLNFLSNSLKFTKSGGQIELGCHQISADIYKIYVKDSGIGITKENQEKIFGFCNKINYQSKEEEQLNKQGCGLGLIISNQMAEGLLMTDNFKGGISVESEYGQGSIFSILVEDLNHFYQKFDQSKVDSQKQNNLQKNQKSSQRQFDGQANSNKNLQFNLGQNSQISQIKEQNAEQSQSSSQDNEEFEISQIEELNRSLHPFVQENPQFIYDLSQKNCNSNDIIFSIKNTDLNQVNTKNKLQENNTSNYSSCQVIDDTTNIDLRININNPSQIQQNRKFQEDDNSDVKSNSIHNHISLKLQPCSIPFKSQNQKKVQKIIDQNNNKIEQSLILKNSQQIKSCNQDLQNQINKKQSSFLQEAGDYMNENSQIVPENIIDQEVKRCGSEISFLNQKKSLKNLNQRKSISIFRQKQDSKDENIQNEQEGFISYAVNKQIEGSRLSTSKIASSSLINEKQSKMICFFKSNLSQNKSVIEIDNTVDTSKNEILIPPSQQHIEDIIDYNLHKKINCKCPQIMLVDDNQFNLYALQKIIQQFQFNIISFSDGDSAIESIKNQYFQNCCQSPQMILMDIEMPNKNGYDTVKEIIQFYKSQQFKNIPVIVACTAYVGQEDYEKSIEAGMDDFINKPILKNAFQNLILNYRHQLYYKI